MIRWEVVTDPDDIGPDDHLRATGYDDQELRRMPQEDLLRLVKIGAVRRRIQRA